MIATIIRSRAHLATALREAGIASCVAGMLAFPILGFRLVDSAQGLSLGYRFSWVVYAVLAVFAGRFVLSLGGAALAARAHPAKGCASPFSRISRAIATA